MSDALLHIGRMERKLLKTRDVLDELGIVYSTLWRWLKAGRFPPPIRLGSRLPWTRSDVDQWIEAQRSE